jgi:predicted alpha/beta-fold hydrolase
LSHRPFRPAPGTRGGHRQTLLGFWHRRHLAWDLPAEDVVVDAGDGVQLLLRATWQPGPRAARPALVTVHGLGGWDQAGYGLATGLYAYGRGWHVVRMNMRGAGDSARLFAGLYNAGLDKDLLAVLALLAAEVPSIGLVGFSLGANLALLALGRSGDAVPDGVRAAVAVSPPLDLAACAARLERWNNRVYQRYFMRNLRIAYRYRQSLRPDLYEAGREQRPRTIREWDEAITAPYGGYPDAAQYYERSSAGPHVHAIRRPALILAAVDDPLIPGDSVSRWPLPASGQVVREMLPTGGHVGFVAETSAPGRFWAAERIVAFLEDRVPRG